MLQAAIMLVIKDGLILGVSRRNDPTKFGLPGGKCNPLEAPFDAAIRECLEETSITVSHAIFLYERSEEGFHADCFYATKWTGEPVKSEEGEVKWITRKEIIDGAFGEYNKQMLEAFKKRYPYIWLN